MGSERVVSKRRSCGEGNAPLQLAWERVYISKAASSESDLLSGVTITKRWFRRAIPVGLVFAQRPFFMWARVCRRRQKNELGAYLSPQQVWRSASTYTPLLRGTWPENLIWCEGTASRVGQSSVRGDGQRPATIQSRWVDFGKMQRVGHRQALGHRPSHQSRPPVLPATFLHMLWGMA